MSIFKNYFYRVTEILEMIKKQKLPSHIKSLSLSLSCVDLNGEDADIPVVKYNI